MTLPDTLWLRIECDPTDADPDPRPLAALESIEEAIGGRPIDCELDHRGYTRISDRAGYLQARGADLIHLYRACAPTERDVSVWLSGRSWSGSGWIPSLTLRLELPLTADFAGKCAAILRGVVPRILPDRSNVFVDTAANWQTLRQVRDDHVDWMPPEGLPLLRAPSDLAALWVPDGLHWLQWWSPSTCAFLRFDPTRDPLLFHRAEPLSGGWLLQLTDAPFHLPTEAHRSAYLQVLDRFPEIGGRTGRARRPDRRDDDPPLRPDAFRTAIHIELAAPPLHARDQRALAIVRRLDALGQPPLAVKMSTRPTEPRLGETLSIEARDALVLADTERGIPWLFAPSMLQRYVRARIMPGPEYLFLEILIDPIKDRDGIDLLDELAALLGAFWGRIVDHHDWQMTSRQVVGDGTRAAPYAGLPALRPPSTIPDPRVPASLGAVNYASPATITLLGLSPAMRDDGTIGAIRSARSGGCIWSLPYPSIIDRDTPRRVRELAAAYARLPAVGGRS